MKAIRRIQRSIISRNFEKKILRHNVRWNSCSTRISSSEHKKKTEIAHNHWSYFQSFPSNILHFDSSHPINDSSLEIFMKNKYDSQQHESPQGDKFEEKLSVSHKSETLIKLFEDIDIDNMDNVLQKKIVSHGNSLQQQYCNVDKWILFDYHNIDINNGYDANGIVICGLSTECNEAYQIGPVILSKNKENTF